MVGNNEILLLSPSDNVFSYDGSIGWGFNSDWDAVPDLHDLVEAVQAEFEMLRKSAAEGPGARRG